MLHNGSLRTNPIQFGQENNDLKKGTKTPNSNRSFPISNFIRFWFRQHRIQTWCYTPSGRLIVV
jgi:hypothetical protein